MPDKKKALDNLTLATSSMSSVGVEQLTLQGLNELVAVQGLSVTFVRSLQQSMVARAKGQEMADVASDIVNRLQGGFPDIAVSAGRDRTLKVWLDGKPVEVE